MGIPVLHGVAGESAGIVEKEQCGLVFEPENSAELVERLVRLRDDADLYGQLKANCLRGAGNYDRGVLAGRLLEILVRGLR